MTALRMLAQSILALLDAAIVDAEMLAVDVDEPIPYIPAKE